MKESESGFKPEEDAEIGEPPFFENGNAFRLVEMGFSTDAIAIRARRTYGEREGFFGDTMAEYGRLKFFNFFAQAKLEGREPSEQEIAQIWVQIEEAYEEERQAEENSNVATIGVEIEIPNSINVSVVNNILANLFIHLEEGGKSKKGRYLKEISTHFSYSSQVQARLIQELMKLGLVPLEKSSDSRQKINAANLSGYEISDDEALSLHVNLGLGLDKDSFYQDQQIALLESIAASIAIAFSSPERIEARKTSDIYDMKVADKSREKYSGPSYAYPNYHIRYEVRAAELRDSTVSIDRNSYQDTV